MVEVTQPKRRRGRPKSIAEPTVPLRIRVPQSQFAVIHELGGVIWLHRVIGDAIEDAKTVKFSTKPSAKSRF